jgi:Protein of unknown function (DUF2975)
MLLMMQIVFLRRCSMRPETEMKLEKVKRISARLRAVCRGFAVLLAILFVVASVGVLVGSGATVSFREMQVPVASLTLAARLALIALIALSMGVLFKGLHHLDRLFRDYTSGNIFTTETAGQIRQLGITSILWTGVNVVWLVAGFGLTNASPPTSFPLHLDSLIIGIIIIVISWFMDAAAEMREENDLTI